MEYLFINRDIDVIRKNNFLNKNNIDFHIKRFKAIDKSSINILRLIEKGIIEKEAYYSLSAIGNAFSHLSIWKKSIKEERLYTVFEDDSVICRNFIEESNKIIDMIGSDFDIIVWGYNFDSTLTIDFLENIAPCVVNFDDLNLKRNIDKFYKKEVKSYPYKLLQAFGLCSYSITPSGAKKLMDLCLPIRKCSFFQIGLNREIKNEGIDHIISYNYKNIKVFASFPPLCVTENDKSISTIHSDPSYARII